MPEKIRVIDLFAGPGGLSEGFSRHGERDWLSVTGGSLVGALGGGRVSFDVALSIEMDSEAHQTLEARALWRKLSTSRERSLYRKWLLGETTREDLFEGMGRLGRKVKSEAWKATLGDVREDEVDRRIQTALGRKTPWVLIGGPPCQAYSLAGRSRNRGVRGYRPEGDARHFLYEQYLRIVARHRPDVFVMENVKGLLSAEVGGRRMFDRIFSDLREPARALGLGRSVSYDLFGLVLPEARPGSASRLWDDAPVPPEDFVVRMEKFGIPQCRHRVILLGIRSGIRKVPASLSGGSSVGARQVLSDLPRLRSRLSSGDSLDAWRTAILECRDSRWVHRLDEKTASVIRKALKRVEARRADEFGEEVAEESIVSGFAPEWYRATDLILNHRARGHMKKDLLRYLFVAAYGSAHGQSPTLGFFPSELLPSHRNVGAAVTTGGNFSDRFRVQLAGRPSTTVTSHISKDGHYYVHYDPAQCRSLTVREAARLQTFPDDYFFCGSKTAQYRQVGNAVPPLFATQIAAVVADLLG